jgi:asparagine synthase (glutamine-hydrolysing)
MAAALHHRGPDDKGVWSDPARGIALAHSRLSILDLTAAGHQPMLSASGRYTIVFNGEIYNHSELRELLDHSVHAPAWRGHSDTEVLCAAIEAWGFEACLAKTVGMFAIALWDREAGQLHLARDRVGEKPLYYGLSRGRLVFASELKALRAVEGFQRDVDRGALALMLRLGYVPAPHSIYRGIRKLPPGCRLSIRSQEIAGGSLPSPIAYWSAREMAECCRRQGFAGNEAEATSEV